MMKTFTRAMQYAILIAIAFLTVQCNNQQNNGAAGANGAASTAIGQENTRLNIACVQQDSLFANYQFAKEITDEMIGKEESIKATLTQKERQLRSEAEEFQRKLQNNAFFSQQRAEQEATRLQQKEIELNNYAQNETQQLAIEWEKKNAQVRDSINAFINDYNAEKKYEVILFKSTTLYIDPKYDITNEVIELLNKRYAASKPKK